MNRICTLIVPSPPSPLSRWERGTVCRYAGFMYYEVSS